MYMRRFTPLALGWAIVLGGIGLVQLFAWASSAQRIVETAPPIPSDEGDICGADCFVLAGAEADAFVGKFTSNMDRLVFALMSGRRGGCVPPYASIDSRWCFDFGVRSGRTLGNESFKC